MRVRTRFKDAHPSQVYRKKQHTNGKHKFFTHSQTDKRRVARRVSCGKSAAKQRRMMTNTNSCGSKNYAHHEQEHYTKQADIEGTITLAWAHADLEQQMRVTHIDQVEQIYLQINV